MHDCKTENMAEIVSDFASGVTYTRAIPVNTTEVAAEDHVHVDDGAEHSFTHDDITSFDVTTGTD
jgi:hypothetical protein